MLILEIEILEMKMLNAENSMLNVEFEMSYLFVNDSFMLKLTINFCIAILILRFISL